MVGLGLRIREAGTNFHRAQPKSSQGVRVRSRHRVLLRRVRLTRQACTHTHTHTHPLPLASIYVVFCMLYISLLRTYISRSIRSTQSNPHMAPRRSAQLPPLPRILDAYTSFQCWPLVSRLECSHRQN
ncbi:hypothetical protein SODALDRAFT_222160 [Sodiomyces alkalinus F11]|uniref:Uncharacterized protein n=1 Tax=Sodiomyces alkalinus (strain CBS 110278 / VKM F-3762 / F11) TaxID=1314773 RepID=A0A3N2PQC6_SODAK|nr:hypothetical protein SODALDRAFT_222160 [Sodiomyces alkalinus F11]ROT36566.1 hypothetical protein SODALDRAFT_222160 [Sodiomyces alkalinus F11]